MSPRLQDMPRPGYWKRLVLGVVLVVFATAGATALATFNELNGLEGIFEGNESIELPGNALPSPGRGEAQTILLLGSDRRPKDATDGGAGTGARSDTVMLARLDPDGKATALLSLPRDLRVRIPGHGTGKLNEAYERGGPSLTLQTVSQLLKTPIHHVINVDFKGFESAIDALGCIYVDVDRRYFNDTAEYAYINIPSGYQRLCGQQALEYARFRHEDTDLVRGVRQQEVVRATKQRAGIKDLFARRSELKRIFGRYTTSDAKLKDKKVILEMLKLAAAGAGQPIRQIQFQGDVGITSGNAATNTPSFVTASPRTLARLVRRFRGDDPVRDASPRKRPKPNRPPRGSRDRGLERAPGPGRDQAVQTIQQGAGGQLPVYYPTARLKGSLFAGPPRFYKIRTPGRGHQKAYRMVIKRNDKLGEYYGVQGTTWMNPPLLEGSSDHVKAGRRTFELYYDGDRVKLVAWRTRRGVYWVSNSLVQGLGKDQMLAIARSTRLP